ncbi:ABC transporter ATP-binding protein [Clavibacter zhangzhiyongii]|jgi:ABC-2 type transport system ATP-binding protein|uniref:ABC transporter ATP-binding protein n=1 Tax=Clavibacter zhangzhiyongii TaxID=2768071 RepID=UPI0039E109E3
MDEGDRSIMTAEGIGHRYGRRIALTDVSFAVRRGAVTGLVGANGSGKSTLLRIMAGVQSATAGRVRMAGELLDAHEGAGRGTGAAVDGMSLWPSWTVRRNLEYVAGLTGSSRDDIHRAAALVRIEQELPTRLRRLSLGNRQRVALAAAILAGTELVLLDEPMNGLDPDTRGVIRDVIVRLSGEGRSVVLSSHDLHDVDAVCSDLLVLDAGRLTHAGPLAGFDADATVVVVRVAPADADRARVALAEAGVRCTREGEGGLVVAAHEVGSALRVLAQAPVGVLATQDRHATLEEKFHGRI